jgi:hypothetical protein
MNSAVQAQLYGLAIVLVFIGLGVFRRMRPQQVRPQRILISGAAITLVILLSLVGARGRIISDPIALLLIPVFIAAGVALGYYLVRTMTFWTDAATGHLWMKGGALFALILVATIGLRLGLRSLVYGSMFGPGTGSFSGRAPGTGLTPSPSGLQGLLYDVSADLLFLSVGLWAARAYFLFQRHRAHAGDR